MTTWLPWEPLATFVEQRWGADSHRTRAAVMNTPVRTVRLWHDEGRLPEEAADRVACHGLGVHPSRIWPEWESLAPLTLDLDDLDDLNPEGTTTHEPHAHASA